MPTISRGTAGSTNISGIVKVTFDVTTNTKKIVMHAKPSVVGANSSLIEVATPPVAVQIKTLSQDRDFLIVETNDDLVATKSYTLSLEYKADVKPDRGEPLSIKDK